MTWKHQFKCEKDWQNVFQSVRILLVNKDNRAAIHTKHHGKATNRDLGFRNAR